MPLSTMEKPNLQPVRPLLPREPGLRAHVRRVAALATRAAAFEGLNPRAIQSVSWAALLHHYSLDSTSARSAASLFVDLGLPVPPDFAPVPESAAAVLRAFRGGSGLSATDEDTVSASLVESANFFDEQWEELPYEDLSTEEAFEALLQSGVIFPPFAEALASFRRTNAAALLRAAQQLPPFPPGFGEEAILRYFEETGASDLAAHSLEVAAAAAETAKDCERMDPPEARLVGLLHDIGRLAYQALPEVAREIRQWESEGFPLVYAEWLVSGTDHAAIGAEILRSWGAPSTMIEAVEHHHRPERTSSRLAALAYASDEIDETLPSFARDHLTAKRLDLTEVRKMTASGD